ncbi:unnamed protein product, partial [Larinioides sclopetarius]
GNSTFVDEERHKEDKFLFFEHDIPFQEFSPSVLEELPKLPWVILEKDTVHRRNLCHLPIFSIDSRGCREIDDAIHCRQLQNGNFEVGVHIADVSHFIKPGTMLDCEAASRGATIHLGNK